MVVFPNAKINLGLNVIRKRADGYHDIESIFYPVEWCDILEIVLSESGPVKFNASGLSIEGHDRDNLCMKALQVLSEQVELPSVDIYLHKQIPMGAGLGGGSSDGSFTLKLLNDVLELGYSIEKLEYYAGMLGSDCPFFIRNKPSAASGRGTELREIDLNLSSYKILIIHTGLHISTAEAYAGIVPAIPERLPEETILTEKIENWKYFLKNDFEKPAFFKYPQLEILKSEIYDSGAIYASMTGSGSAMYGIFKNKNEEFSDEILKRGFSLKWC